MKRQGPKRLHSGWVTEWDLSSWCKTQWNVPILGFAALQHIFVIVVQLLNCVWFFGTLWIAEHQASLSFTISWSLLKLMSIESMVPSKHLILCCPLLLLPSIFSSIRVFSSESTLCIRWPKHWSFSIIPSNECSGLISFRIDWLDLLAVQGTLKGLHHHSLKASILWHSTFFMIHLWHLYMNTGKTKGLTIGTFVGKVMSLPFNTLLRFVIAFLLRSKPLSQQS